MLAPKAVALIPPSGVFGVIRLQGQSPRGCTSALRNVAPAEPPILSGEKALVLCPKRTPAEPSHADALVEDGREKEAHNV